MIMAAPSLLLRLAHDRGWLNYEVRFPDVVFLGLAALLLVAGVVEVWGRAREGSGPTDTEIQICIKRNVDSWAEANGAPRDLAPIEAIRVVCSR